LFSPYKQFTRRHLGPRVHDTAVMLQTIGINSLEELCDQTVPKQIRLKRDLQLEPPMSETEALAAIRKMADKNQA
ncbi:unnamed protein product, partial [Heterosigma akashiwo]